MKDYWSSWRGLAPLGPFLFVVLILSIASPSQSEDPDYTVRSLTTTAPSGEYAMSGRSGSKFCPGSKLACFTGGSGGISFSSWFGGPYMATRIIEASMDPAENAIGLGPKTTLDICDYWYEGYYERQGGEPGSGVRTKTCFCTSDGGVEPVYSWKNITGIFHCESASIGTDTTCPDP